MADYGLLGGLAEGLKQGLLSYRDERGRQDRLSQEEADRQLRRQLAEQQIEQQRLLQRQRDQQFDAMQSERDRRAKLDDARLISDSMSKGLIAQRDESGAITGFSRDSNFKSSEQRQIEREERAEKREMQRNTRDSAVKLRTEYSGLPTTKTTQEVASAFERILESSKDPSPASDISLIINFMKMQDPGSVVRPEEFKTAQFAESVPGQIKSYYNQVVSGQRLTPRQRADFLKTAKGNYAAQLNAQKNLEKQYTELANRYGVDPELVLMRFPEYADEQKKLGPFYQGQTAVAGQNPSAPPLDAIQAELARRGIK